jgi:hypothetical protein
VASFQDIDNLYLEIYLVTDFMIGGDLSILLILVRGPPQLRDSYKTFS